ncbi:MAG: TlpA family protein disulfide reductase [Actinomycetota bacterium]|nr:TlpA family protein disulfide reductase [Actinomycetota bacterium]
MTTRGNTDQPRPRTHRRVVWRYSLVLLAAAVAATVALWPRTNDTPRRPAVSSGVSSGATQRPAADVAAARVRAQLSPCPAPGRNGQGPGWLRGVRADCLSDATSIDLGAVLAGRSALINVWASWCEVCRKELPVLDTYARSPGAVQVLGVQILSDPAEGLDMLASLGVHLPSVNDTDGTVTRALHAPAYLPVSYVVTSQGTIRQVIPPTPFSTPDQIERTVQAMTSGTN